MRDWISGLLKCRDQLIERVMQLLKGNLKAWPRKSKVSSNMVFVRLSNSRLASCRVIQRTITWCWLPPNAAYQVFDCDMYRTLICIKVYHTDPALCVFPPASESTTSYGYIVCRSLIDATLVSRGRLGGDKTMPHATAAVSTEVWMNDAPTIGPQINNSMDRSTGDTA